ncbi:ribosome biogenesis regulatory protein [Culex quinquefasciatus]|uniref:Ribosome biogenesis regulatory protein n=1 Tax=Culex quinquefasciatus TaxID=7176 RepID=B0X339_CULQU|nr:ribosome biogenesis regulatory protein [Culex quinquefasciatus]|eukprot:XP_001864061.1 ribosome biogenesis regulatory protein [Culex quinquefasciatus]
MLINAVCELLTEGEEDAVVAKMHVRRQFYPVPETPCAEAAYKIGKKIGTNEVLDKSVPTYGYQRFKAETEKEWVVEVLLNAAKNKIARMRNIAHVKKIPISRTGFPGPDAVSTRELVNAANAAKASTSSVGDF